MREPPGIIYTATDGAVVDFGEPEKLFTADGAFIMILGIGNLVLMLMVSLAAMGLALAVGFGLHFVELGFHDSVFMHGVGSIKRFHLIESPQLLYESILFMKMSADTDGGIGDKSRDKTADEQRCENRNGEDNHFMPQFSIHLEHDIGAAVSSLTFLGIGVTDHLGIAIADDNDAAAINALAGQVVGHGLSAEVGELLAVFAFLADLVDVALNLDNSAVQSLGDFNKFMWR